MNAEMKTHSLSLTGREVLKIFAVSEVQSFDETAVTMTVGDALLSIGGTDLSVSNLSLENGEVTVCGHIDAIVYQDGSKKKKGFGRFFAS